MSPETNVQEKLTVTAAPPPAAIAADKKKAQAKKRTEAENLIDGHAAGIKTDKLSADEKARSITSQGRKGGLLGFFIFGLIAFWTLTHHGRYLHWNNDIDPGSTPLISAYHRLERVEWFFGLTSRAWQFRIFLVLSPLFLLFAVLIPRQFGRFWIGLGNVLGTVVTPIFISVLFYVGVTPLALILRMVGSDPLRRAKLDGSYWITREKPRGLDHFEHKF
jgi:Saxitoxin biosynthesis operon protein SxtJ